MSEIALTASKSGEPRTGNPEVSEADLAWLAGILDGEGSIATWLVTRRSGAKLPYVKISVANTDWSMIARVKYLFWALSGRKYKATEKWQTGQKRRQWQVFCNRRASMAAILRAVFPYLVTRRRQAWAAMEWCRIRLHRGREYPHRLFAYADMIRNATQYPTRPEDGDSFETVETGRRQLLNMEAKGQSKRMRNHASA